MYSRGAVPASILLELLNVDPESCRRQLEEDLFTINDSKFNDLVGAIYQSMPEQIIARTDVVNKLAKGLGLKETEMNAPDAGMEGSGEGS
jgi:hypothetical protein